MAEVWGLSWLLPVPSEVRLLVCVACSVEVIFRQVLGFLGNNQVVEELPLGLLLSVLVVYQTLPAVSGYGHDELGQDAAGTHSDQG